MVTAPRSTAVATLTALAALLAVTTCRDDRGTEPRPPTMAPGAPSFATSSASGPVTLVGAGNIAKCGQPGAGATANLLDAIPGTVFADGDNAYDNGTPTQKDEPTASNPPAGAAIDYYPKTAATGPVTLEIQDRAGSCLAAFSSDPAVTGACAGAQAGGGRGFGRGPGGGIPNTSALWRPAPEPFATSAGMHRVNWAPAGGGRGGRGGSAAPPAGPFTAKLTVGGQTYTQTFDLKPDPRVR